MKKKIEKLNKNLIKELKTAKSDDIKNSTRLVWENSY